MKLKLKHIAPYLPYNLQVEYKGEITTIDALDSSGGVFVGKNRMVSFIYLKNVKPILRPISSMTKEEAYELGTILISEADMEDKEIGIGEMKIMGATYPTIVYKDQEDEDYSVTIQFSSIGISGIDLIPYEAHEWLFKHHFDVFGLVEKCLAIDKTTFK